MTFAGIESKSITFGRRFATAFDGAACAKQKLRSAGRLDRQSLIELCMRYDPHCRFSFAAPANHTEVKNRTSAQMRLRCNIAGKPKRLHRGKLKMLASRLQRQSRTFPHSEQSIASRECRKWPIGQNFADAHAPFKVARGET